MEDLEYDHWAFEVRVLALHCLQLVMTCAIGEVMFRQNQYLKLLEQSEFEVVGSPKSVI
jgi:hypothetical protein